MIGREPGIDESELYFIIHAAYDALGKREAHLSDGIIKRINQQIKREWMVFAFILSLKGFDFILIILTGRIFFVLQLKFHVSNLEFKRFNSEVFKNVYFEY